MELPDTKNIIFDFDGVIADTDNGRFIILSEILENYNIKLSSYASVHDLEGVSTFRFLKTKFPKLSESFEKIIKKRHSIYMDNLDKYCKSYPNTVETIKKFHKEGWRLYLATTNDLQITLKLLKHLDIEEYFSIIMGRETTEIKETNLKSYKQVFRKLNVSPNDCIIIEDSLIGVEAAKRENAYCIAFNHYNNDKINKLADDIIKSYSDLQTKLNLNS